MNAVLVQADQLSLRSALLKNEVPQETVVLLIEDEEELGKVPFHKQRLVFVLSAMRHFAEALKERRFAVDYYQFCKEPAAAIRQTLTKYDIDTVNLMRSASWGVHEKWSQHIADAGARPKLIDNDMFISNRLNVDYSLSPRKAARMESFYRKLRKSTGILMNDEKPTGGQWNFDKDNRLPPDRDVEYPKIPEFEPDSITSDVISDVSDRFPEHFGNAIPFQWPVTCEQAHALLTDFFENRFAAFGPYQDAMVGGNDTLFHSLISACLNIGLLDPEDVCHEAEHRYRDGDVPLNSAEGFIRQILGWREFVYQLYRANMPGYEESNYFEAEMPLPSFYWDAETRMRCVEEAVRPVIERGLSHHIQRLMITGNFALLAGVSPQELNRWYWLGFIDAWHWVVTPNVIGMATFADGGLMATKPYAASANYIHRMSDYCDSCPYNPKKAIGENACPFNSLYWDFLDQNESLLSSNPRMALSLKNLQRKSDEDRIELSKHAKRIRSTIEAGKPI